jgi:hypothetical protein
MFAAIADWEALWKIAVVAFAGGVGVTAIYGFLVMRAEALERARQRGETATVAANGLLVGVCAAICIAAVVLGFIAMTHKS